MKNLLVRGGVLAATGAVVSGALLVAPAAQADPSPSSTSAGTWLTTQVSNGLVRNSDGSPDFVNSVDVALAELQGGTPGVATQIRDALAPVVTQYIEGANGVQYGGRTASVLRLVQDTNGNALSYGGVNLVSRLESLTEPSGRVVTSGQAGSYSGFSQALGVQTLTTAKSPEAPAAAAFLVSQQCPAGFFLQYDGAPGCSDPDGPDTDTTALAVLALQGQLATPATRAAADKAVAWLKARQAADGSFVGSTPYTPTANSNSTGLAAAALGASCQIAAADRAAQFVRSLQVPAGTTGALANSVGAVAYDQAALADGRTNGISDPYQWRSATSQSAAGLTWDPNAVSTIKVKGPRGGFVKAGDSVEYRINRVSAGERVCVTTPDGVQALTGTGSSLKVTVKTRKKADTAYEVSATTGPGAATKTVTPLPRARLKSAFAKRVGRGDRVRVVVKKLEAKEKVLLKVDGKVVAKGKADDKGRFVTRFRAPKKLGKHTLLSQGGFANRKVRATFTVTR